MQVVIGHNYPEWKHGMVTVDIEKEKEFVETVLPGKFKTSGEFLSFLCTLKDEESWPCRYKYVREEAIKRGLSFKEDDGHYDTYAVDSAEALASTSSTVAGIPDAVRSGCRINSFWTLGYMKDVHIVGTLGDVKYKLSLVYTNDESEDHRRVYDMLDGLDHSSTKMDVTHETIS